MRRHDTAAAAADHLRIGPWRGDPTIALLSPTPGRPPSPEQVRRCLDQLRSEGRAAVLTPALGASEQTSFRTAGFVERERLHLLGRSVRDLPKLPDHPARLRRARHRDLASVLAVDALAFDSFWTFDAAALRDARLATPRSRFRVAVVDSRVIGYHVTGAGGRMGYLQRLAVHPDLHGRGIGTALVRDALEWSARRGCSQVLVNTQETNDRAYALYRHLGFTDEPTGLAVLSYTFDDARTLTS